MIDLLNTIHTPPSLCTKYIDQYDYVLTMKGAYILFADDTGEHRYLRSSDNKYLRQYYPDFSLFRELKQLYDHSYHIMMGVGDVNDFTRCINTKFNNKLDPIIVNKRMISFSDEFRKFKNNHNLSLVTTEIVRFIPVPVPQIEILVIFYKNLGKAGYRYYKATFVVEF